MMNKNQELLFRNVVHRSCQLTPSEMGSKIDEFFELIEQADLTPAGPFFYMWTSDTSLIEELELEFYLPVQELLPEKLNKLHFQSLFWLSDLFSITVETDFCNQKLLVKGLNELEKYMTKNDYSLEVTTCPIFLPQVEDGKSSVTIFLEGAEQLSEEEEIEMAELWDELMSED